jgi:hypothetical protein
MGLLGLWSISTKPKAWQGAFMAKLKELVGQLRSKNAGAFEITFDIMFNEEDVYQAVKRSGIIGRELFARLYKVPVEDVLVIEYDAALAIKGTIPRRAPSGSLEDTDVYGAQQHAPLLDVEIPI